MPLVQTRGAASAQGFGEFAQASVPVYIEDVFNTYLYTGNDTTQIITNGIDLATKGGMVWAKSRSGAANHVLVDTAQGTSSGLIANDVGAAGSSSGFTSFDTTGFTFGGGAGARNNNGTTYAAWTWRKQPKYFDVVTYTGTGSNTTIPHSLGAVPGCIIVKRTDTTAAWAVYHRSLANTQYLVLNTTAAAATGATWWNSTTPTSAVFSVGTDASVNASGGTYVAYIFAHDAGGFGLAGTDNVISCGSFTSDGSGGISPVNLGFEPQWLLVKNTSADGWRIQDVMRGWSQTQLQDLSPSNAGAERVLNNNPSYLSPTATGFSTPTPGLFTASNTFIYIAIRRGPMKVPTVGTSVFEPQLYTGTGTTLNVTGPTNAFQYDSLIQKGRSGDLSNYAGYGAWTSKLQKMSTTEGGESRFMGPAAGSAETAGGIGWYTNDGFQITGGSLNLSGTPYVNYWLRRAPSFFDVVCYTGTEVARTINHNLGVAPELLIVKRRDGDTRWRVYNAVSGTGFFMNFDGEEPISASGASTYWNSTTPTASVFSLGDASSVNGGGYTFVAYLFATCAGVSKVGSYTGNAGNTVTVPCGFTAGVRFVLIKRTDDTADWYVWDSARGIIAGNDPYLRTNLTTAEVTNTDYVDTYSAGFEVTSTAPAALNATGGTYIFLAIA